jgi:hypothetical protein
MWEERINDGSPDEIFTGDIAEIRIYNTPLSLVEIQTVEAEWNAAYVPEPTTTALLGLGELALILRRRK